MVVATVRLVAAAGVAEQGVLAAATAILREAGCTDITVQVTTPGAGPAAAAAAVETAPAHTVVL